ncbi:MAG: hypothetical protein KJ069_13300 [Anaerolineae bacterium]|nr:hypothetical protein [Anaerolineae bacterium]
MGLRANIRNREWTWAVAVALATAVLILLPYWLGSITVTDGRVYMHLIMNPEDSLTYWAKMWQGAQGAWLYTIPFTPESHPGAAIGVFYVWLGQFARVTGLSLTAVWHLSRVLAAFVLFVTIFGFTAVFLPDRLARWTAYLLALFGSGLGWLLFLSGQAYWLDAFPLDFKDPGAHIFFTSLTFPHIALGTALILFDILALKRIGDQALDGQATNRRIWVIAALAGLSNLLLGIAYPFLLYIVAVTAVLYFLYLLFKLRPFARRSIPWLAGFQTALLFLIPAPLYLYFFYVWQTNDIFRIWDAQAGTPSPPWPHYLVGFGVMLVLAGLVIWKRPSTRPHFAILWCWIGAVALLIYAPLGPQRRFIQGVHVALAILAATGLVDVLLPRLQRTRLWQRLVANPRYTTPKLNRFMVVLFLLFMSLSNIFLLADVSRIAALEQPDLFFRPADELAAVKWLQEQGDSAVILADYQTGNLVAAYTGHPVMLGHWAETADYEGKVTAVAQFFDPATPDAQRQALLNQFNVRTIWFGPREQALGDFQPDAAPYLIPVYQNNTITLYAVTTN